MVILLEMLLVLAVALALSPVGRPVRDAVGLTGIVLGAAVLGAVIYAGGDWLAGLFARSVVGPQGAPRLESRRRIARVGAPRTRRERRLDAMTDAELLAHVQARGRDALAVEILAERLKAAGDLEAYARETEYLLTLDSRLALEEKCSLYNELADLYLDRLGQPLKAKAALQALASEFPRSYQAVLARQRLSAIEERERSRGAA